TPEGTLIDLDESASGIRVNSNVTYLDGSVIVDANKIESAEEYYAMETPKGGTYHMELPDGTQVWLNADSRIYYPLTFTGTKRVVKLIGEAYFEVAHDPNKIFIVETKDEKVKVLGTKFNVKAYPEDAYSCTTLKEGKVEVEVETPMDGIYTQVLLPNQQSIFKN